MNSKIRGMTALFLGVTTMTSVFAAGVASSGQNSSMSRHGARGGFEKKELTDAEKKERQAKAARDLSQVLGMNEADIVTQMQNGKTIKDIILASGKDKNTVIKALKQKRDEEIKAQLSADVASGKITQTQADEMMDHKGGHRGMMSGVKNEHVLTGLASILGVDAATLKSKLDSGKTIKDIAAEVGMNETDIKSKIETFHEVRMKAILAEEVSSGKITQAQSDEKLAEMKKRDREHVSSHHLLLVK